MSFVLTLQHWFARPWALALLAAALPLALLAWRAGRLTRRDLQRWADSPRLAAGRGRSSVRGRLAVVLALAGAVGLVLGVAGPRWGRGPVESATGRDIIAVLDVSRSMSAQDATGSLSPDRLGACLDALLDLAREAERSGGHRLALVAFAARPQTLCPLTEDDDFFREAVRGVASGDEPLDVGPADGTSSASGTRIGRALRAAAAMTDENAGAEIVLLSDGDDPGDDREWEEGMAAARSRGISVTTVGVGDPEAESPIPGPGRGRLRFEGREVRTRLREGPLREIAQATGGVYVPARLGGAAVARILLERPIRGAPDPTGRAEISARPARWQWLFVAALGLLAAGMLVGGVPRLGRPPARASGDASTWRPGAGRQAAGAFLGLGAVYAFWAQTPADCVRLGNRAFERGEYAQALHWYGLAEERTDDPGLVAFNEGAACFRLGRYREAEIHYLNCRDSATGRRLARCLYDLGNALSLGAVHDDVHRLRRAVASYEQCLGLPNIDPVLAADARVNLAMTRAWLHEAEHRSRQPTKGGTGESRAGPTGTEAGAADADRARARAWRGEPGRRAPAPGQTDGGERPDTLPEAGAGNLPAVPDGGESPQLTPEEAAVILKATVERIRREKAGQAARRLPASAADFKDW